MISKIINIEDRIRTFLSADTLLHREMDKRIISIDEIERRCDSNDPVKKRITNRFLWYNWGVLKHYLTPFLSLLNEDEFISAKQSVVDYSKIMSSTTSKISLTKPKFNIIVPVRNRKENLESFIQNGLRVLRGRPDWAITVVFQEENDELYNDCISKDYPDDFGINFINIPNNSWFVENYGDNMNKSLCYNIASLMVACEYQINHDVDLIFNEDFILNVEEKTKNKDFKWLQPFRGSRVFLMTEDETRLVKTSLENTLTPNFPQRHIPLNRTPDTVGAPGGSIVVRHQDFIEIGGYDPELVWGYAPEDSLFWYKLEAHFGCVRESETTHPFFSNDVFSHETSVELYHMFHPPTPCDKRYPFFSTYIVFWLMNTGNKSLLDKWIEISKQKMRITT